jgi:hypothetical protein
MLSMPEVLGLILSTKKKKIINLKTKVIPYTRVILFIHSINHLLIARYFARHKRYNMNRS